MRRREYTSLPLTTANRFRLQLLVTQGCSNLQFRGHPASQLPASHLDSVHRRHFTLLGHDMPPRKKRPVSHDDPQPAAKKKRRTNDTASDDPQNERNKEAATADTPGAPAEETTAFRFKDLPPEIRTLIYGYVLDKDKPLRRKRKSEGKQTFSRFNILFVDKQLHDEAKHVLHSQCTFLASTIEAGKPRIRVFETTDIARSFDRVTYLHDFEGVVANQSPRHQWDPWLALLGSSNLRHFFSASCPGYVMNPRQSQREVPKERSSNNGSFWQRQRAAVPGCNAEYHNEMRGKRCFTIDLDVSLAGLPWAVGRRSRWSTFELRTMINCYMVPTVKLAISHGWRIEMVNFCGLQSEVLRVFRQNGIDMDHVRSQVQ